MKNLNRSQRETLRMIIASGDEGASFTELKRGFPNAISQRGLTDALRSLEKAGLVERSDQPSKGARRKYRITHPAPRELVISDVINFLKLEPTARYYTGVLHMGLLLSSSKQLGVVLNEDKEYNQAYLKLFLIVHDKWCKHIEKTYREDGKEKELKIVDKCEEAALACCMAYSMGIFSPFTEGVIAIDSIAKVRLNFIETSDTIRAIPAERGRRPSYVDLLLATMDRLDKEGTAPKDARAKAESYRRLLKRPRNKGTYEAFLSRCVVPRSVLFLHFGFTSPLVRYLDLMKGFAEASGVDPSKAIVLAISADSDAEAKVPAPLDATP